jgi:hypothetical protein
MFSNVDCSRIKWLILGLQTPVNVKSTTAPARAIIESFIEMLHHHFPDVPIFCKHSIIKFMQVPREFPAGFPINKKRNRRTSKTA